MTTRGSNPGKDKVFSSSSQRPDRSRATPTNTHRKLGFFPGLKRPQRKVNLSTLSSAENKGEWSHNSMHPVCHHGMEKGNVTSLSNRLNKLFVFLVSLFLC
jgi:hypothetical protein